MCRICFLTFLFPCGADNGQGEERYCQTIVSLEAKEVVLSQESGGNLKKERIE